MPSVHLTFSSNRSPYADIIAFKNSPLDDLKALKDCAFVMKDGEVFKMDGKKTVSGLDVCIE